MSELKKSPEELKKIFEKYAAKQGDPDQLCKDELKQLINAEFPHLLKGPTSLDDLFKELDKNGDGEVSFEEFQILIKKDRPMRYPPGGQARSMLALLLP